MRRKFLPSILFLMLGLFLSSVLMAQVNMDRYITLTVQQGEEIYFIFAADTNNTPVKIVSGSQEYNITVDTSWTGFNDPYIAGDTTMTIYGNIKKFDCSNSEDNIIGLDVSHNTALTVLVCVNVNLSSLDVSGCSDLRTLCCHNNINLTSLNVSDCTALTVLDCSSTKISSLDVSGCTALVELWCFYNINLSSLDVSQNTALTYFNCSNNNLPDLDVSQNTALTKLWCNNNNLSNLDVSQNTPLKELHCRFNNFNSLDVSQNTALEYLICYGNSFSTNAVDTLFCSLPDRNSTFQGKIYILNNTLGENYDAVLASNKQNAIAKKWRVVYQDGTDIPETSGTYECGSGIEDIEQVNIEVYPNPVSGLLNIEGVRTIHKVEVFNCLGQLLDVVNTNNNSYQYHTEKLNTGYYMFKIHTDNGVAVKKVMKR